MTTYAELLAARGAAAIRDRRRNRCQSPRPCRRTSRGSRISPSARTRSIRSMPASMRSTPTPASSGATRSSRRSGTCRRTPGRSAPTTYQRNALDLLEKVAVQAVAEAGLKLRDIDTIVTNTITGLAIPSLEARLMNRLAFRPDVERLPIFGLGCGGGVAGISRAARMAQAQPGSNVLFLTVDLCSLCLRINDPSLTMFVAAALFGDGAAGVVLRSPGWRARSARPRRVRRARASAPSANTSGRTPSTSWAGTSRTMASASC